MSVLGAMARATSRQLSPTQRLIQRNDPDGRPPEELFGPDYLTDMIIGQDRIPRAARALEEYLHVSDLKDLCGRYHVLAKDPNATRINEPVTPEQKVMWEIGLAVENHVIRQVMTARQRFGIVGRWECRCGVSAYEGLYSPAYGKCKVCGHPPTIYKQLPMVDNVAMITGAPDLPLYVRDELMIVEIKSIGTEKNGVDTIETMTKPIADHEFQATAYQKLARLNGFKVKKEVTIFYVSKKYKWGVLPYKEFCFEPSSTTVAIVDRAWEDAKELAQDIRNNRLPRRIVCNAATCPRAKKCQMLVPCWTRTT